jgi:hypothetical protein
MFSVPDRYSSLELLFCQNPWSGDIRYRDRGGVGALRPSSRTSNSNDRTGFLSGHGEMHDQGLYGGRVLALSCKARLRADATIHDSCRVESESALRRCRSSYWHRRAYRGNGWSLASFHDQTRHYLPIVNVTRKQDGRTRSFRSMIWLVRGRLSSPVVYGLKPGSFSIAAAQTCGSSHTILNIYRLIYKSWNEALR